MLSTHVSSTDRARILIGAYGKAKSHFVLVVLSLLMSKNIAAFEGLLSKIKEYKPGIYLEIDNHMRRIFVLEFFKRIIREYLEKQEGKSSAKSSRVFT